jgi:hypothetical protein
VVAGQGDVHRIVEEVDDVQIRERCGRALPPEDDCNVEVAVAERGQARP